MSKQTVKDPALVTRDAWIEEARKQTLETLPAFLAKLAGGAHDYNTSCYAVSTAATAAACAMNHVVGLTVFQASYVLWDFRRGFLLQDGPAALVEYEDLLYPQYAYRFRTISREIFAWVQEQARARRDAGGWAGANVRAHWDRLIAGEVPFGLSIRDEHGTAAEQAIELAPVLEDGEPIPGTWGIAYEEGGRETLVLEVDPARPVSERVTRRAYITIQQGEDELNSAGDVEEEADRIDLTIPEAEALLRRLPDAIAAARGS